MPRTCSVLYSFLLFLLYSFQRVFFLKLGHACTKGHMIHTGCGGGKRSSWSTHYINLGGKQHEFFLIKTNEYVREQNTELYDFFKKLSMRLQRLFKVATPYVGLSPRWLQCKEDSYVFSVQHHPTHLPSPQERDFYKFCKRGNSAKKPTVMCTSTENSGTG